MNHYFHLNKKIKSFDFEVDCSINKAYTPLTEEQSLFYEQHQDASLYEVKTCMLYESAPLPAPNIEEVKESAKKYISNYSAETMGRFITDLKLANASASLSIGPEEQVAPIYTNDEAKDVIRKFNIIGAALRNTYHFFANCIDNCSSVENIDNFKQEAINFYDEYQYDEPSEN